MDGPSNHRDIARASHGARALFALGVVTVFFVGKAARADPRRAIELDWAAPSECPSADEVLAEVDRIAPTPSDTSRRVSAHAAVARTESGYRVDIATLVDGTKGSRSIEAQSCELVARATAVILALTSDPGRASSLLQEPPKPPAPPPRPPPSTQVPLPPPPPNASPVEPSGLGIRPTVTAGGGLQAGWTPKVRPLLSFGGGVQRGMDAVVLRALWVPRFEGAAPLAPSASDSFEALAAQLEYCRQARVFGLVAGACPGFTFVDVFARAAGKDIRSRPADAQWVEFSLALRLRWAPLGSGPAVGVDVQAAMPTPRHDFTISGLGRVHRVPSVTGIGVLALDWAF